ncbi:MAG TPA: hypothetical protein VHM91_24895, partial [Verrucomicrobiales bacterium]|nr:hypothetical protein [Verrucomicrobiales bacterium]
MNPIHQCSRAAMVAAAALLCYSTSSAFAQSDSFATATPIVTLPVTGTNAGATKETGEANHGNNAGGSSVWFSWTATVTGYYRVDLAGSSYDTELGIYTGTSVDTTVMLAQNDDSGAATGTLQSAAVVYVKTGETILIAVDGYRTATGTAAASGSIKLDIIPLPAAQVPPANDLFSAATDLGSAIAGQVTANNTYGTREAGEPRIGALYGGSSLWWKWTAPADGDMEFSVAGATTTGTAFNTGIGVYTGTELSNLVPVAASGPATTNAVQVAVTAGTVYYIAADASSAAFIQPVGNFTLRFAKTYIHTIFPYSVAWDWLHPSGSDPSLTDPDFNTTWFSAALYDGPAFNLQGGAMLGYGGIDFGTTVTNIVDPGTGSRYSAYFRRVFNIPEAATDVIASILADDGAYIYIDGVLVKEVNMPLGAADTYTQLASAASSETVPVKVSLGPLAAGQHEIAVSVHNAATDSSDLGFALSLLVDNTPPPTDAVLTAAGLYTGFEEPVISAASYLKGTNGTAELGWIATAGQVQSAATHPAAGGAAPAGKFFKLNAVRTNPFRTDRISLASLTAEQKAGIVASA